MKTIVVLMLFLMMIVSCKHREIGGCEQIIVNDASIQDKTDISDLVESVKIIPIKENNESNIGFLYKLFVVNGKYVVCDFFESKKIELFDSTGEYIKTVMRIGHAPTETSQITNCWVSEDNELNIYDAYLHKLYQYDSAFTIKNEIVMSEKRAYENLIKIPTTENYVAYTGFNTALRKKNENFHISFLNKKLDVFKNEMEFDKKYNGIEWLTSKFNFFVYKDTIRLLQAYNNYVYSINKSDLSARYHVKYSNSLEPDNVIDKIVGDNISLFKTSSSSQNDLKKKSSLFDKYAFLSGNWIENEKYIYFSSQLNGYIFFTIYDKNNRKVIVNSNSLELKKYKISIPNLEYYDHNSNSFIGVVFGEQIKYTINSDKFLNGTTINPEIYYIVSVKFKK